MNLLRMAFHGRVWLVSPPLVLAACCFHWETENTSITWPVGLALVLLGVALRVWAQEHIWFLPETPRHLATTGPYAFTRNPLYIANTLICLGATVISELLWVVPITLVWCAAVYSLAVLGEEQDLLAEYGKPYFEYMARTPRWVPKAIRLEKLQLRTEHLGRALAVEIACLLIVVPFVVKELVSSWVER